MAHTTGPWKAEDRGHRVHGIRFFWLVPDKVSLGSANPDDAALAAAAPDLLEAVQNLMGLFDNPVVRRRLKDDALYPEVIIQARAAIARAKGE